MIHLVDRAYTCLLMDEIGKVLETHRPKTAPQQVAVSVVLADLCGAALGAILATGKHLCERDGTVPAGEKTELFDEVQRELMALATRRIAQAASLGAGVATAEIAKAVAERGRR